MIHDSKMYRKILCRHHKVLIGLSPMIEIMFQVLFRQGRLAAIQNHLFLFLCLQVVAGWARVDDDELWARWTGLGGKGREMPSESKCRTSKGGRAATIDRLALSTMFKHTVYSIPTGCLSIPTTTTTTTTPSYEWPHSGATGPPTGLVCLKVWVLTFISVIKWSEYGI